MPRKNHPEVQTVFEKKDKECKTPACVYMGEGQRGYNYRVHVMTTKNLTEHLHGDKGHVTLE